MLIDSHAHLTMPQFDADREAVIVRAQEAGLAHLVTVGTDLADCEQALALAEAYERISVAVGIHPHDVQSITDDTYERIRNLASHKKVVAIGEIGLDFYRDWSPRDEQRKHFRKQVQLAREISLPVVVHKEVVTILQEEKAYHIGGVIHCFSGDWPMAKACLDMGFYISIPGTVTYKGSHAYRDLIRAIPTDRLLIETDCPFLSPHPFRGKRNEPAYVLYVAREVGRIREVDSEEIGELTTHNAMTLFNLAVS
ncbi:MAG TPA: TatD family hydrolase [Thermodesulfobacteriota bacterium]|nr:TatD family hydrolase [Thermodesulfobacteriota bacterium]